jgi:hypothetical protein
MLLAPASLLVPSSALSAAGSSTNHNKLLLPYPVSTSMPNSEAIAASPLLGFTSPLVDFGASPIAASTGLPKGRKRLDKLAMFNTTSSSTVGGANW